MAAEFESGDKCALLAFDSLLDADADAQAEVESDDDDVQIIEPDEEQDEEKEEQPNLSLNTSADVSAVSPSLPDLLGDDPEQSGAETRTPDDDQGPDASCSADVKAEADDDIDDASTEPAVTDHVVDLTDTEEMADKSEKNDGDEEIIGSDNVPQEVSDMEEGEGEEQEDKKEKETEEDVVQVGSEAEEEQDDKDTENLMQVVSEVEEDGEEENENEDDDDDKENMQVVSEVEEDEEQEESESCQKQSVSETKEENEQADDKDEGDGDKDEKDGDKDEEDGDKVEEDGDKVDDGGDKEGDKKDDEDEKENKIEVCMKKVPEAEDEKEQEVVKDSDTTAEETTVTPPVTVEDTSDTTTATAESPSKDIVPEAEEAVTANESSAAETESKENHDNKEDQKDESQDEIATKKERPKRKNVGGRGSADDEDVSKTVVKCTSCGSKLHCNRSTICAHPILKVVICKMCLGYYTSGSFSRDADGMDEQCRWCAEGGKLVCCDVCTNAFCQSCIRREFGGKELSRILKAVEWRCLVCDPSPLAEKVALCERVITVKKVKNDVELKKDSDEMKPDKPEKPAKKDKDSDEIKPEEPVKKEKDGVIGSVRKWTDSILAASTKVTEWATDFGKRLADFQGTESDLLADVSCIVEVVHGLNSDVNLLYECVGGKKNNVKVKGLKGELGKKRRSSDDEMAIAVDPAVEVDGEDSTDNKAGGDGPSVGHTKGTKCKVGVKEVEEEKMEEDVDEKEADDDDDDDEIVVKVKEVGETVKECMKPPGSSTKDETPKRADATSSDEGPASKRKTQKQKARTSTPNKANDNDLAKKALLKVLDESEDSGHSSSGRRPVKSTDDDDTDTSLLRKMSPRKTKKTPERAKKKATFTPSSESDRDEVGIGRLRSRVTSPVVPFSLPSDTSRDPKLAAEVRVVLEKLPMGSDETPMVSERGVSSKRRRVTLSNSDSDSLGKCVAKLANLSSLKGGRAKKKKRCQGDSDEESTKDSGQEKKKDGKKKRATTDESEASDRPADDGGASGSDDMDTEDGKAPLRNLTGKAMCENDYAKATLVNDLQENSSHGDSTTDSEVTKNGKRVKKAKQDEKVEEDGEKSEDAQGSGEEDGDRPRKKSKAVDKLLRIPLEEKASKGSDSDAASAKEFKIKKRRRLAVSSDDSGKSSTRKGKKGGDRRASRSSSDSESQSDEEDKKSKSKGRKIRKRRRIINVNSSSDGSDDSDNKDKGDTPSGKGRKNIRKLIKDKKLADDTKTAAKEEEDRKKRIAELQKLYNVVVEAGIGDHASPVTTRLILEVEKDTNKPLIEVHPKLIRKLKPHQVDGVKFLWASVIETMDRLKEGSGSGCMLAHCMGLGKTLQVITFVHTILSNPITELNTCLIVCPLNTVINWANEFNLWIEDEGLHIDKYEMAGVKNIWKRMAVLQRWHEDGGVLILGYEMFRLLAQEKGKRFTKRQKEVFYTTLIDPGPDVVVCDEGHILKNDLTALSKTMNNIRTKRRIVLTGTPLQNNLVEYHCMVNFVKPNLLGNLREFRNRFANPISNGQCADSTIGDVHLMKRRAHILHNLLDGCVQRQDYGVLTPFLPPKQEYVISVRLSELQITLYRHYLSNLAQRSRGSGLFSDYQNLMKIWTHPMVLKMAEIRDMNKTNYESEDSFIDDDSSENSESSRKVSDSEDDVVCLEDGVAGGSGLNKGKPGIRTRSKNAGNSSDEEIINTWKTRSRSQRGAKDAEPEEEPLKLENIVHGWWNQFIEDKELEKVTLGGKLVILLYILRECEAIGDKILIFSQSLLSLDLIEQMLRKCSEPNCDSSLAGFAGSWSHGLDYFRMDGSTSPDIRNKWTSIFNDPENFRARLFLISTRAGSLGINLVSANRVIIFDASWNPTHDVQSIFRVYRFGQEKPVYVYRLLAQGTMEEKIYDRQVTKQSLACRVVDEKQIERHFNAADLQELYMFTPEIISKRPIPMVPKDRLLAELLIHQKEWIVNYHEHDSLLENRPEEVLSEGERKAAWEEYEAEKKGMISKTGFLSEHSPLVINSSGTTIDVMRIKAAILEREPGITSEELTGRLQAAMQVLRNLEMQQQQARAEPRQQMTASTLPRLNFPMAISGPALQAQLQNPGQVRRTGSIPETFK